MTPTNKRNAKIAFIIGLLIGILAIIGNAVDDDGAPPPPLPSDGAQFRYWLCTEYDQLVDVGC